MVEYIFCRRCPYSVETINSETGHQVLYCLVKNMIVDRFNGHCMLDDGYDDISDGFY